MVIDALGGPGVDDPSAPDDAPLSAKALTDAKASGVTAVNVTVNQVGNGPDRFEKTIDNIASVEYEIAAHPDRFLKVLRASDLRSRNPWAEWASFLDFKIPACSTATWIDSRCFIIWG